MRGINTQPISRPDRDMEGAITAPIRTLKRPAGGRRDSVRALDVLVLGRYAHITGNLPVVSSDGNPVEYRVLLGVSDADGPVSSDQPHRVVGAGVDEDRALLAPTRVGRIECREPLRSLDIIITKDDVDPSGWLDLRGAMERHVAGDDRIGTEDVDALDWIPDGALLTLDLSGLSAGVEWLVVRFEAREVLDASADKTRALHGSGRTALVHVGARARAVTTGPLFPLDGAWRL